MDLDLDKEIERDVASSLARFAEGVAKLKEMFPELAPKIEKVIEFAREHREGAVAITCIGACWVSPKYVTREEKKFCVEMMIENVCKLIKAYRGVSCPE